MRNILLLFSLLSITIPSLAQQDPLYAQYYNNPMLINPAFAGSFERLYAGVAYRSQWSGMTGGPTTFNFNGHMALANNKVGAGLMVVQDQLGDVKNTEYAATGAYRIKLNNNTMFSFGMQAGFTRFTNDPNAVKILQTPDPAFYQFNETKFNVGAGVLVKNDKYTVGLSVPHMLPSTIGSGNQSIQVYGQNYYLFGSYLFVMSEHVDFKPSALLRATAGSSASVDLNANFTLNKMYTAGIFTRKFNTYGLLLQIVMSNYRLGYVFELPGKGSALNFTTHEIGLSMSMAVLSTHNISATGF